MIGQGQTAFRIQSLSLELLQETLAEARAGRLGLWESLAAPAHRQAGSSTQKIASLFDEHTDACKDFAYDLAEEINRQLVASEEDKRTPTVNDEDKQGRLAYDSDAREEHDPQAA